MTVSKKTEGNKFKRDAPAEETDGLLSNCFFLKRTCIQENGSFPWRVNTSFFKMHLRRKLLRIDFLRRSISEGIVKLRCRYFTTSWPAILRKPCCFGLIRQLVGGMSFAHQITISARLKSQGHESRPCSYPWERDVLGNSSAS